MSRYALSFPPVLMLDQLTIAVGEDVMVERPKYDYLDFRPKDPDLDYDGKIRRKSSIKFQCVCYHLAVDL